MSGGQIVVDGLTKVYKKLVAVDHLSFTVQPGRVTGFLGPNGAGKTTTLRMVLNLVRPDRRHRDDRRPALRRPARSRCARSAPSSRRRAPTAAAPAATTCGCCATRPGFRSAGPTTCWTWCG